MKYKHVTWNDAIYMLANLVPQDPPIDSWMPPYGYREYITKGSESTKYDIFRRQMPKRHPNNNNCPSYKDFVIALSGYGLNKATDTNAAWTTAWAAPRTCVRGFGRWWQSDKYSGGPGLWGRTFGAYKGKDGKPIAECRPLDMAMFQRLRLFPFLIWSPGDGRCLPESYRQIFVILSWYHHNGWGWCSCTYTDTNTWYNSNTGVYNKTLWRPLPVGVYAAFVAEYYTSYRTVIEIGDANGNVIYKIEGCGNNRGFNGENGIFFVDSPGIQWRAYWDCSGDCPMGAFLARLVDSADWTYPPPA